MILLINAFFSAIKFGNPFCEYQITLKVKLFEFILLGDGNTWEIHLGTRLRVKVVPP